MSIKVVCEGCRAKLVVRAATVGQRIKCPKCGEACVVAAADLEEQPVPSVVPSRSTASDDEPDRREDRAARARRLLEEDDEEEQEAPKRKKKKKRKARRAWNISIEAVGWMLLVLIALGIGAFFGIRHLLRSKELQPFNDRIAEYLAEAAPANVPAYVEGKMLPINAADRKVDSFYYDIPERLRASSPEEVGTVVLLSWGEKQVGTYTGGARAYVRTCSVVVVDHAKRLRFGAATFEGGQPPSTVRGSANGYGSYPYEQVMGYLRGLLKR